MPINKIELSKKNTIFKEQTIDICDRIYRLMEDDKAYNYSEISAMEKQIIEELKPIYGDVKLPSIWSALGFLSSVGLSGSKEAEGERYHFKQPFSQQKLSELTKAIKICT